MDKQEFFARSRFFAKTSPDLCAAIAAAAEDLNLRPGETLFREGDPADALYMILSGTVVLTSMLLTDGQVLGRMGEGETFGVVPLLGESQRVATASAESDVAAMRLSSEALEALVATHGDAMMPVLEAMSESIMRRRLGLVLRDSETFRALPEDILADLEKRVSIIHVTSGTTVCAAGDRSDALWIVISGRLRIWSPDGESDTTFLNEAGPAASVGEMGVITGNPRAANVIAVRDSVLARLAEADLRDLLRRHPEAINRLFVGVIVRHFARRAPGAGRAVNSARTFALIPIRRGVPLDDIARQLREALSAHGSTLLLDSRRCDDMLGRPGMSRMPFDDPRNDSLIIWLDQQESNADAVIYLADPDAGNWSRRCLRQADHVLFVGRATDSPMPGEIETELARTPMRGVRKTLLLVHDPATTVPSGTLAWLAAREVGLHHHLRLGHAEDYARLARFLTGHSVALVFGGGGARGFAHAGVIRALRASHVPIDLVGGTSMGALIGAQCAMQFSPERIVADTLRLCLAGDQMTLPMVSLFSGKRFSSGVRKLCGDRAVEDLWHRYYSVSCNISRGRVRVHDRGPLYRAVLASNTPPAIFPPFVEDGDLHLDGALLNNLPVDVMQRYSEGGQVIAVDVDPQEDMMSNTPYDGGLSGWTVLGAKVNPLAGAMQVPNVVSIIARATAIGGIAQYKASMEGLADLYLSPPTVDFAIMAYKDGPRIAEIAYDHSIRAIEDWLRAREEA